MYQLIVSFPVHICHAFLTVSGTKRERAHAALVSFPCRVLIRSVGSVVLIQYQGSQFPNLMIIDGGGNVFLLHFLALFTLNHLSSLLGDMGPAVLNGGLSTLIAFILLLSSDSHVFSSFFKIFMLVVLFGVSFPWKRRCYYHCCFPR